MKDRSRLLVTTHKVITSVAELFHGKVDRIKYKKGFSNKDVVKDHGTSRVYSAVLFKLLELMIYDVIDGSIVYFNKTRKSFFYVDTRPVNRDFILGKSLKKDMKIPIIDLKATNYRTPFIAFDPGGNGTPCMVTIPAPMFTDLVHQVNSGKKYIKGKKNFWINTKK